MALSWPDIYVSRLQFTAPLGTRMVIKLLLNLLLLFTLVMGIYIIIYDINKFECVNIRSTNNQNAHL